MPASRRPVSAAYDPAVDRIHARVRFGTAIALVALMGATFFAGSLTALMHPLIAAVEQLNATTRGSPDSGLGSR